MSNQPGLDPLAYEAPAPGDRYRPWVSPGESLPEFTPKALLLGIVFGVIFGAANAYLGLRAGLTVSTSIPVAVMSVAVFRALAFAGARSSILEANLAQTTGSASSSLASGIIFTLPALFMWGLPPDLMQMALLAVCGGLIGVLFMIPLRRFLIDREHGRLPYPEGTACAEVLVASEVGGGHARQVFVGLGAGALFKFLTSWLQVIPDHVVMKVPFLRKGELGSEVSAALFGVGFILGPRIATVMVGGGLLSSLLIIPAIAWWGGGRTVPLYPETLMTIDAMTPGQIWSRYVRYIGAGAVATAGILTLIRSIPVMLESFRIGAGQMRDRMADGEAQTVARTDTDLPYRFVAFGLIAIAIVLAVSPVGFSALPSIGYRAIAAICVVVFAFFFVTVSSRIVGLVGVTSNPTSGMTIAALLATATIFLALGWTDLNGKAAALTVGCVVAIAASIAGDMSQDLKTGYLLGATPRRQQTAEVIGVLTSAVFVCGAVLLLSEVFGFGTRELPAPQATLMKLVIDGVIDQSLPWPFVGLGAAIAIGCALLRVPSLPFAVGVYLPVATMVPVFLGGAVRYLVERSTHSEAERSAHRERGVLLGSGFVGGEGLLGVGIAAVAFVTGHKPTGFGTDWIGTPWLVSLVGAIAFAIFIGWFARRAAAKGDEASS
jgi:putative OPT family oligopeptide transporter